MNKLPSIKSSWPADTVERRPVKDLLPYTKNARTHSAEQVTQIARSITEFGWTIPILIDEAGTLIAGHGRVLAAKLLGIDDVPCMVATGWSEAQRRAYVIADNKLTLNGGWDDDILRQELLHLGELKFDVSLLGFGMEEIAALFAANDANDREAEAHATLAERFGVPPFSVLRASEGWWQERKRAWIALGIKSELGRGGAMTWGDSPEITEAGLNHYRNKRKAM